VIDRLPRPEGKLALLEDMNLELRIQVQDLTWKARRLEVQKEAMSKKLAHLKKVSQLQKVQVRKLQEVASRQWCRKPTKVAEERNADVSESSVQGQATGDC